MNKYTRLLLGALAGILLIAFGHAAATTYTRQNARLTRFQCDPVYTAGANPTSVPMKFFFVQRLVNDADATDVRGTNTAFEVSVDLLDPAVADLPVNGVGGLTFSQLAVKIREAGLNRANAAGIQ